MSIEEGVFGAEVVEGLASQVVDLIRDFIECLRNDFSTSTTAPSLPSASAAATGGAAAGGDADDAAAVVQRRRGVLISGVTVTRQMQTHIDAVCRKVAETVSRGDDHSSPPPPPPPATWVNESCSNSIVDTSNKDYNQEDEETDPADDAVCTRQHVVFRILQPLIKALCQCYHVLDRVPVPPPPPLLSTSSSARSNQIQAPKPPPPIGMLSLRNYTDIAALVEFTVCTSILPLLENDILPSVELRARHLLPRTLQGRLVRACLLWGQQQQQQQQREQKSLVAANAVTVLEQHSHQQDELWETAMAIGNLVCLDRFRPILLPRHLSDIYAAIFQCEALRQQQQQGHDSSLLRGGDPEAAAAAAYCIIPSFPPSPSPPLNWHRPQDVQLLATLGLVASRDSHKESLDDTTAAGATLPVKRNIQQQPPIVEAQLQARAFQSLLLHGRKGPLWLRQRVGPLLNGLAAHSLLAVLDVYIHAAASGGGGGTDQSAASLRLASALTATGGTTVSKPEPSSSSSSQPEKDKNEDYLETLVEQLILVLDQAMEHSMNCSASNLTLSNVDRVNIRFIWAVLDQLPDHILEECVLEQLITGPIFSSLLSHHEQTGNNNCNWRLAATPASTVGIHRAIRRLCLLLSNIPTSCAPAAISRFCRLVLLAPLAVPTNRDEAYHQDHGENITIKTTLFGLLISLASDSSKLAVVIDASSSNLLQEDTIWTLRFLIETVVAAKFPSTGRIQMHVAGIDVMAVALAHAVAPSLDWDMAGYRFVEASALVSTSVQGDGSFARVCIQKESPWNTDVSRVASEMERRAALVIKELLKPLLPKVNPAGTDAPSSPAIGEGSELPSRLLQLLLVMYNSTFSNTKRCTVFRHKIFQLVPLALLPVLCEHCSVEALLFNGSGQDSSLFDTMRIVFEGIAQVPAAVALSSSNDMENSGGFASAHEVLARILSIPDIEIVNESVASDRDMIGDDQELTWSIVSVLLSLLIGILELGATTRSHGEEMGLRSLIPSLKLMSSTSPACPEAASASVAEVAEMASHALALVASRKALSKEVEQKRPLSDSGNAFGDKLLQAERDLSSVEPPIRARGVVTLRHLACAFGGRGSIGTSTSTPTDNSQTANDDNELLHNLLVLSIAALADKESYVFLAAVQTIAVIADQQPAKTLPVVLRAVAAGNIEGSEVSLSNEQRIKLAESLISIIRRRAAIYEYVPLIMDVLTFGATVPRTNSPAYNANTIQVATHEYFRRGNGDDDDDEADELEDPKERYIRLNTGGPIFDSEETDVVRSAIINIVAEVVSVAQPSVLAPYCSVLVDCAIRSLQLDASRPVRRAGAFLARQLYTALVREVDGARVSFASMKSSPCPMAVSMGSAEEDTLEAVLQRCVSGADVGDWANEKGRTLDSATVARCEEALARRNELEQDGIFTAARLAGSANHREDAIARMLGEGKDGNVTTPLHGVTRKMIEKL